MWKQHWKSIGLCFGITVGIIILLLIITSIFEYLNIHVPGSREMWIGLTGAVIGGAYTMFGVLITIFKQEEETTENLRLSNLPVLGFKVLNYQPDDVMQTISFIDGELSTTANPDFKNKFIVGLEISMLNNACAFDFAVVDFVMNGKKIDLGRQFHSVKTRLVKNEEITICFDCVGISTNIFCLFRFTYKDILGHQYYQDFPFIYDEIPLACPEEYTTKQLIEIRDIKAPILANSNTESLETAAKEYLDYDTFCRST